MIIHEKLPPKTRYGTVACDLELFDLRQRQLHRPHGELAIGSFTLDGENAYLVYTPKDLELAVERLRTCEWVFHNSNFDIRHIRRWANFRPCNMWDTLVIERILWSGWYSSFGLGDLARRYLNKLRNKGIREQFYKNRVLTPEMKQYAAEDVCDTWHIKQCQESFLHNEPKLWKVWLDIDQPALWAILDFKGFTIDTEGWHKMIASNRVELEELETKLGFNPGSPKQTLAAFKERGVTLTDTNELTLKTITYPPNAVALRDMVLEYRGLAKECSSYGDELLTDVEADGRIYPDFSVFGAETGRTSSSSPNLQNIPARSIYRNKFVAAKNCKLVIADFSSQEMWISYKFSGDPLMYEALQSGGVYEFVAREMYHDDSIRDKKHPLRQKAKAVALGRLYGLTPYGLELQRGIPKTEGADLFSKFDRKFAGTTNWIAANKKRAEELGYVETLGGRRFYLNFHMHSWPNNATNAPIQGTGGDMIKLALGKLHKEYGQRLPILNVVHDELVAEFPNPRVVEGKALIKTAMEWAFHQLCPGVDAKKIVGIDTGRTWAAKE